MRGARAPREAEENGGAAAAVTTATPPQMASPRAQPLPSPALRGHEPSGREQAPDERDGPFRRRPRRRWVLVVSEFGAERDEKECRTDVVVLAVSFLPTRPPLNKEHG